MERIIKEVGEEIILGKDCKEISYFISMSDDERIRDIENYSTKLLNPENVYIIFLKRIEL